MKEDNKKKINKDNNKKSLIKKSLLEKKIIIVAIVVLSLSIISILFYNHNKDIIKTEGIKIYYRTYTKEEGWTKWSQNGKVNGTDKYPIRAIQIKVKSKKTGDVFYNTYSNRSWNDNDSYSGKSSGDKKHKIKKIKIMLSDTLYKKYNIKYRLYTNNIVTEYGYNYYELFSQMDTIKTDDSEFEDINKIQIVVEKKGDNNEK